MGSAALQIVMKECIGDLYLRDYLIYLDDITIDSTDINFIFDQLYSVFNQLSNQNMIFKRGTTYLGHVVFADGNLNKPLKNRSS